MIKHVLHTQRVNLEYAKALVKDIPDAKMCVEPAAGMNHAAWVLGHLAVSAAWTGSLVGRKISVPAGWDKLFGNRSKPTSNRKQYPKKAELLRVLKANYAQLTKGLKALPASKLGKPFPDKQMRKYFPTLGDVLVFMATAHDATHLGQLSAWRRVQGLPSVF